jgi:hypothetical protein
LKDGDLKKHLAYHRLVSLRPTQGSLHGGMIFAAGLAGSAGQPEKEGGTQL